MVAITGLCVALSGFAAGMPRRITSVSNAPDPASAASRRLDEPGRVARQVHRIPYRMSETLHIIVRAKLNGKGPFNFIVDTGAPAMFVTTATAKEADAKKDANGWSTFERMELEGGAFIKDAKARAEDIFQIRGMNSLNLPGVRLDGVLGYNILARYRMEFDLAKSTMTWTELEFDPELPEPLRGDGSSGAPPELEFIGNLMQGMGALLRRPDPPPAGQRGSLGVELAERDGAVFVQAVLPDSPAKRAGIKPGDHIARFSDATVPSALELLAAAALIGPDEEVRIQVIRNNDTVELTAKMGRGF
jgi:hypothetical protein